MKIELRNPTRTLEMEGPMSVIKLLNKLDVNNASVLVICDGTLVPNDALLQDDAVVEIRNVISGGSTSNDSTSRRSLCGGADAR